MFLWSGSWWYCKNLLCALGLDANSMIREVGT